MFSPSLPAVPRVDVPLSLGGRHVDLRWRALVAAIVPASGFGRASGESEVAGYVEAAATGGADLADVSLPADLVARAVRTGRVPVAARASSPSAAEAIRAAGADLLLVPADLAELAAISRWTAAVLIDDPEVVDGARRVAETHRLPLAVDTSSLGPSEAAAVEAVTIARGCRIVCTVDARRTRRVVETMAALLAARRTPEPQADR